MQAVCLIDEFVGDDGVHKLRYDDPLFQIRIFGLPSLWKHFNVLWLNRSAQKLSGLSI